MRTITLFGIAIVAAAAALPACSSAPGGTSVIVLPPGWSGVDSGATLPPGSDGGASATPDGGSTTPPPSDAGAATGVPCDVATMLASMCTGCHSDPPAPGALAGLVTYADLMATSHEDSTKNEAQLSLARMQSTTAPMPPGSPSPAADVTILQNWIAAGYPKGSCGGGDGGEGGGAPPPPPSVFTGAPPFKSMLGQDTHNAGRDCLHCHNGGGDPQPFAFGGTLYDTTGAPVAGAEVRLVDAKGNATSVYTSSSGTFFSGGSGFAAPAQVGVRDATNVENMLTALQSTHVGPATTGGACSACHCSGTGCTVPAIHLP